MKTILIVDDDQQLRGTLAAVLGAKGYRTIEADSGQTGLALARRHLPDLILSDIHMPGGDGAALLTEIRRDAELRSKQVVLMTGRPDLVTLRKSMEEGADDFLVKPVERKALLSCVEARFNRSSINWRVEDQALAQLRSSIPPNLPHECFTPLAGIIGLMDILEMDFADVVPPEVRDIHLDIQKSARRLQRTLRNYLLILDLQGMSDDIVIGKLGADEIEKSLNRGIAEAVEQNERCDDVRTVLSANALSVLPDSLSRMVEELVDNACKFSRRGTPIQVEVTAEKELIVKDQGRGMTGEEIAEIGAFRQFDRKKLQQQGLGLGLVLVQKLSLQCGARFHVTSVPGEGTAVTIQFS